jgi:hypothetical protein
MEGSGKLARRSGARFAIVIHVGLIVGLIVIIPKSLALSRYSQAGTRINQKIAALVQRRPQNVSEALWKNSVDWTSIALCNVCFDEEHAPYAEMLRYERELDERLEGPVDLKLLDWARLRLAETGSHGRRYVERWRPDWDASIGQDIHADRNESDPR